MKPAPFDFSLVDRFLEQQPTLHTLDNGLQVAIQPKHAQPLVSVQLWVRTGSIHESPNLGAGVSHFIEHMLFKGTAKRPLNGVSTEIHALGSEINAYTAFDRTVFTTDGPAEVATQLIDILADMALHPALSDEAFAQERNVILREIDMGNDDTERTLARSLLATAFQRHPYRHPVIGHRPLFEATSADALRAYFQRRYQPSNMVLVVVGAVDPREILDCAAAAFDVPMGFVVDPPIPSEPLQLSQRVNRHFGEYQLNRSALAFKIPSMRHADAPALDVLAATLGGGFSAFLNQRLVQTQKVAHSVAVHAWNPGEQGLLWFELQTPTQEGINAEQALLTLLQDLRGQNAITPEALEKAQRFAFISEIQSRQTTAGLAARIGLVCAILGDPSYPARYLEAVRKLTVEHLHAVAHRYVAESRLSIASLNNKALRPPLRHKRANVPPPDFHAIALPNGARIVFQPDASLPRVHFRLAWLGGPAFEDSSEVGATALLAALLARDNRFRSAQDIHSGIESAGGIFQDFASNNYFGLAVDALPSDALFALRLLEDAVLFPHFKPHSFQVERDSQLSAVMDAADDPMRFASRRLRRHFFGKHPFANPPLGTPQSVQSLTIEALHSVFRRLVVAPNTVLALSGDFDPEFIVPYCLAFLKAIPGWQLRQPIERNTFAYSPNAFIESSHHSQAIVFDAFPCQGHLAPNREALEVLDELLSDMSGPLFHSVRDRQSLAYFVGASNIRSLHFGQFNLYAGTHPESTDAVFQAFDTELDKLRNNAISSDLLHRITTRLKVQRRTALQSAASRAEMALVNALLNRPIMDWLDYEQRLDALTADAVRTFAQSLDPAQRTRFTLQPKSNNA